MAASVYAATEYTALFGSTEVSGPGGASGKGAQHSGFAELPSDDPAAHFSDTGVGQVLFSSGRGDSCRRVLFDNRTGANYESKDVACGPRPEPVVVVQPPEPPPNRLTAVRKSFQR